jgi:hypothetical protein
MFSTFVVNNKTQMHKLHNTRQHFLINKTIKHEQQAPGTQPYILDEAAQWKALNKPPLKALMKCTNHKRY